MSKTIGVHYWINEVIDELINKCLVVFAVKLIRDISIILVVLMREDMR